MYKLPLLLMLITSCSLPHKPLTLNSVNSEYAEVLFKRQNQVTLQVMMLLEDDLSIVNEELLSNAELQMHDRCHLLNEAANKDMSGEKMSLYFKAQARKSFPACDKSVGLVESLLKQLSSF